ncbi:hypothetical protein AQPE_4849 [Aquipluma nitroreducens]|uniref:DUF4393 domain-containing protein n=1 Tax=Aquipluma nitroreducens TaxID=2010828 RepID=A0A5K7SGQ5_9BACT|nr:Abi-alpha family protein [Aquipluma nitroreducens]BBE20655.1 hypothetical protein AQPE_4849 [Aquipluma nitroreducens]
MESENKSLDILGIKPVSKAIDTSVKKTFQGIEAFLKSVCAPALDEVGLMLRDKIRYWRLNNILRILEKAKGKINFENDNLQMQAHPRIALAIIENGSLNDNDEIQELWAGLFASSCTPSGQDDENLIFIDLLKQLTSVEAKILNFTCENARKIVYPNGLVTADDLQSTGNELFRLTGKSDLHSIDRQLDHLRSLELIVGGFSAEGNDLIANITPTDLALNLYVRCQGVNESTAEYWKSSLITQEELEKEIQAKKLAEEKIRKEKLANK